MKQIKPEITIVLNRSTLDPCSIFTFIFLSPSQSHHNFYSRQYLLINI